VTSLTLVDVTHRYPSPAPPTPVLERVHLQLEPGATVALTGPSGAGKSTLTAIAGLLLAPTEGRVLIGGVDATALRPAEQVRLRSASIGFLFQQPTLMRHLTVLENVMIPMLADHRRADPAPARQLLEQVGLREYADALPGTLSGGQAQRVALCRALIRRPAVLLADEPTAGLDKASAENIRTLLRESADRGVAVLIATHDPLTMRAADRLLHLDQGELRVGHPDPQEVWG
jgi:ABC-type lipoprotein export system ATPase subunit